MSFSNKIEFSIPESVFQNIVLKDNNFTKYLIDNSIVDKSISPFLEAYEEIFNWETYIVIEFFFNTEYEEGLKNALSLLKLIPWITSLILDYKNDNLEEVGRITFDTENIWDYYYDEWYKYVNYHQFNDYFAKDFVSVFEKLPEEWHPIYSFLNNRNIETKHLDQYITNLYRSLEEDFFDVTDDTYDSIEAYEDQYNEKISLLENYFEIVEYFHLKKAENLNEKYIELLKERK